MPKKKSKITPRQARGDTEQGRSVKNQRSKRKQTVKGPKIPTAEQLLEAGVHFGHLKSRWHPKMAPYIFTEKEGIHIFDLYKTREKLREAARFLRKVTVEGAILFVGTKKQAREVIRSEAERVGAYFRATGKKRGGVYFLTERWIGGLLTNLESVRKNIEKLEELSRRLEKGEFAHYTKKERLLIEREIKKLDRDIGGLRGMKELPAVLVLASAKNETIAAREAQKVEIPVVAIADTNADPGLVDYIIPGNDDARASIKIIIQTLANAIMSGKHADKTDENR